MADTAPPATSPSTPNRFITRRLAIALAVALLAIFAVVSVRQIIFAFEVRANAWNINDVMTMLRNFKNDNGHYPQSLAELEPYNFSGTARPKRLPMPNERAQDLTRNSFGQPLLYSSDGQSYTLVSPGRHGYQRARVVPWPEFDGAHNADTSLVIVDNVAKELALAKGQIKP